MHTRPTPLSIDAWVRDIGRRGAIMAEIAIRDKDVARDLVQDSLLAFISRYADKPAAEWTPLFYTILRSQIMDWKRRQARRSKWLGWLPSFTDDDEDGDDPLERIASANDPDPAELLARADDMATVQAVLETLPARQQQAFLLRAWEGLDIAATAAIMACSESSVKTHYTRALQALRAGLVESHGPAGEPS